ncbi:MAG: AAA family ATPase, partial [Planctomycetaceae bacterium]|nr:AAA family ATPase [Planctomycetaceae bacterium]
MRIESIEITNFRALQKANLKDLPALGVFVGRNGVGKSTLFDVFGFMRDALVGNVRTALQKRGGFKEVVTRGHEKESIGFEFRFRQTPTAAQKQRRSKPPIVTYRLEVANRDGTPVVARELLQYRRGRRGQPWRFLDFENGAGKAIVNEDEYEGKDAQEQREDQQLESPDILAIKGLGQFQKFKAASEFRRLIEGWHVSDFHITEARSTQEAGLAEHLNPSGENAALVAQYLYENHRDTFNSVLEKMKRRVPGVSNVEALETEDGRIVLRFQDGKFKDPFIARYVSDGTIKMFVYLLLLHDPSPHPLLCVEEPENQLYHELLGELVEDVGGGGVDFGAVGLPDLGDVFEHLLEAGAAVAGVGRKVGAAEE